ncbi:MAG: aminotransferase class I/II-fold pyridoxal phosphate-dependent enzyme [bacterium]|nr:aminotransferase class I/II-fold pyridoxal phosphate-dependent enzyme [bacterium]
MPEFLLRKARSHAERVNSNWQAKFITRPSVETPPADSVWLQSNDYLSLGYEPAISAAWRNELGQGGLSVMMSAVFEREGNLAGLFEKEIARHMGAESAILCQSGFAANCGLIEVLARLGVPVYIDFLAHRSMWFGAMGGGVRPVPFLHNSTGDLEKRVRRHGPGIILIDSVYSATGAVAPLRDFANFALVNDCVLVVDESHSLGTHGRWGEGMVARDGLEHLVHYRTASLAKAFCGPGGVIVGDYDLLEMLRFEGAPQVFSSATLSCNAAGFLEALRIIRRSGARRRRLRTNAMRMRRGLRDKGLRLGNTESQIMSLYPGPEKTTVAVKSFLEKRGVFGSVFAWPATPRNRSLIRFSVRQDHTRSELQRVIDACGELALEFNVQLWRPLAEFARPESAVKTR